MDAFNRNVASPRPLDQPRWKTLDRWNLLIPDPIDACRCTIPSSITVSRQFLADNKDSIYADGVFVKSSVSTPNYGFLRGSLTSFSYTIPAGSSGGVHTVGMRADNTGDLTGFAVQLTIKGNCPKSIELSGKGAVGDGTTDNPN
jgi:hypothetical protein